MEKTVHIEVDGATLCGAPQQLNRILYYDHSNNTPVYSHPHGCGTCRGINQSAQNEGRSPTARTPQSNVSASKVLSGEYTVAVLVPFRSAGCERRENNWRFLKALWSSRFPGWEIVEGDPVGHFSRASAIRAAATKADADVFVVADADCWTDNIQASVEAVAAGAPWVNPATKVSCLDEITSSVVLRTGNFPATYQGGPKIPCGGLVVLSRAALIACGPDEQFTTWGSEDNAWTIDLQRSFGEPIHIRGDLWHLWHPRAKDADVPLPNKELLAAHTQRSAIGKRTRLKPRVCLVSDVRGWAFDINAHDIEANQRAFSFEHFYVEDWIKSNFTQWHRYDVIYEFFNRNPSMRIPMDRALGALRSEWFKAEKPASPSAADKAHVNSYRAFQVATKRNYNELIVDCPRVVYLTNPINTQRFQQTQTSSIVASWNGNAHHGRQIKHFYDVIIPSCSQAGIHLIAAEYSTVSGPFRRRVPADMPSFYQQASVALCASEYEAASFSVMEAMASGLALIATDVGNHREMRDSEIKHFGDSGIILVECDANAFSNTLSTLTTKRVREMGEINRAEIEARWSWSAWHDRYEAFFRSALG